MNSQERLISLIHKLPVRVAQALWPLASRGLLKGDPYFFMTNVAGRSVLHGGIYGVSEEAYLERLNRYQPETLKALREFLPTLEHGVVLDVGANIGQSLLQFKALRPDLPVHLFEPIGAYAALLEELCRRNGFSDCRVVAKALGDREGTADLSYGARETLTASFVIRRPRHERTARVAMTTLDAYAATLSEPIALIKIDVEGFEPEVIRGAAQTLAARRPPLLLEWLDVREAPLLESYAGMERSLRQFGYKIFQIGEGGRLTEQNPVRPDPAYRFLNYLVLPD